MLCSVVHIAVPVCLGIIVIDILVQLPNSLRIEAALPPGAEDEIVLIEHLPGRRVHLQDFFWTGAEDAPPWLDPDQTLSLYETRTIHHTATIYVPGDSSKGPGGPSQDPRLSPYDPGCISCIDPTPTLVEVDQDIGILVGEDPGPRYWLLTVLRSGENVPPKVELRLARLYRAAFSRQQQRHLGLLATDPRLRRAAAKHRVSSENRRPIVGQRKNNGTRVAERNDTFESNTQDSTTYELVTTDIDIKNVTEVNGDESKRMREVKITDAGRILRVIETGVSNSSEAAVYVPQIENYASAATNEKLLTTELSISENSMSNIEDDRKEQSVQSTFFVSGLVGPRGRRYPTLNTTIKSPISSLSTNTTEESFIANETASSRSPRSSLLDGNAGKLIGSRGNDSELFDTNKSKLRSLDVGIVQVRMQNTSVTETGSTRLIYSVHLGGKPVPAETAAKDMALLSPQEVALELGVPVIIQSEPYLKETRPLALSRKRDAWLLIGAAGAALILLTVIIAALFVAAKRKRAHSAVSAPPTESILKKDRGYTPTTPGMDNTGYTSETEARTQTDGTSQRQTPGTLSRSPITPLTPQSINEDIQELSSDNDEELKRQQSGKSWDIEEYPEPVNKSRRNGRRRVVRTNAMDQPRSPDSMDTVLDHEENLESFEDACLRKLEETASPHSYLSMPSCKLFPNMRTVEPLSKILEPVVVRHLDLEYETPEMARRSNGVHSGHGDDGLNRTRSALKDPGVVGPIVWDLRRQRAVEDTTTSETDVGDRPTISGPVGRARRRLHELLEDSFSLFGTRDARSKEPVSFSSRPNSAARTPDRPCGTVFSESRGKSAHVSPVATPITQPKTRPRTSLPRGGLEEEIPETGNTAPHPRGAWGSRPLSAGPFHRPNLPEVDVTRVLADPQLPPEDPAVPLIAAIRKELDKFTPELRT